MGKDCPRRKSIHSLLFISLVVAAAATILPMAYASAENESAAPASAPEEVGMSSDNLVSLDEVLSGYIERQEVAGLVAIIGRKDRIVYEKILGMADIERNIEMRSDTLFRITALTEVVLAVGVLMLYEDGLLELNDPVSQYLPHFGEMNVVVPKEDGSHAILPAEKDVTIHNLLSHTAGMPLPAFSSQIYRDLYSESGLPEFITPYDGTLEDAVQMLSTVPLAAEPGTAWQYGLSTLVLGSLIEVLSGVTLEQFLHTRILEPLEMNDTHAFLPAGQADRLATIYGPSPAKPLARYDDEPNQVGTLAFSTLELWREGSDFFFASYQLLSTAGDFSRFAQMLVQGGKIDGVRLITEDSVALMTTNQIGSHTHPFSESGDKYGYSVGIRTSEDPIDAIEGIGSYGWGGILYTNFWSDPVEEMWVILMSQRTPPHANLKLRMDLRIIAYQSIIR